MSQTLEPPDTAHAGDPPWVVVRVAATLYALSTNDVQEMVSTPTVSGVPGVPSYVRGLITLRGQVMPLVDLRRRFGLKSQAEEADELVASLAQREQDHKHWLNELEASVRERRRFALTTDPHACAFGRWFDAFRTDNLMLETVLKRFDQPHQAIHALGREVVEHMAQGAHDRAASLVQEAKSGVLARLVGLFAEATRTLRDSQREIAVVTKSGTMLVAMAVDGVESVERLNREDTNALSDVLQGYAPDCAHAVARRARDQMLVLQLRPASLLSGVIA